jgi:hypothetical protein
MKSRWELRITAFVLCGILAAPKVGKLQALEPQEDKRAIATPEETVKSLVEASKADDLQAYISCLAEPFRVMRKALVDILDAQKTLFGALDEKFGKTAGLQQLPAINNMKKTYLQMRIKGEPKVASKKQMDDGSIVLEIRVLEKGDDGKDTADVEKFTAVKEGTTWKLAPWEKVKFGTDTKFTQPDAKFDGFLKLLLERQKKAIVEITQQVKNEKFKSRREVQIALQTAMQEIDKELVSEKEKALGKPQDTEFKPIGEGILKKIKPRSNNTDK